MTPTSPSKSAPPAGRGGSAAGIRPRGRQLLALTMAAVLLAQQAQADAPLTFPHCPQIQTAVTNPPKAWGSMVRLPNNSGGWQIEVEEAVHRFTYAFMKARIPLNRLACRPNASAPVVDGLGYRVFAIDYDLGDPCLLQTAAPGIIFKPGHGLFDEGLHLTPQSAYPECNGVINLPDLFDRVADPQHYTDTPVERRVVGMYSVQVQQRLAEEDSQTAACRAVIAQAADRATARGVKIVMPEPLLRWGMENPDLSLWPALQFNQALRAAGVTLVTGNVGWMGGFDGTPPDNVPWQMAPVWNDIDISVDTQFHSIAVGVVSAAAVLYDQMRPCASATCRRDFANAAHALIVARRAAVASPADKMRVGLDFTELLQDTAARTGTGVCSTGPETCMTVKRIPYVGLPGVNDAPIDALRPSTRMGGATNALLQSWPGDAGLLIKFNTLPRDRFPSDTTVSAATMVLTQNKLNGQDAWITAYANPTAYPAERAWAENAVDWVTYGPPNTLIGGAPLTGRWRQLSADLTAYYQQVFLGNMPDYGHYVGFPTMIGAPAGMSFKPDQRIYTSEEATEAKPELNICYLRTDQDVRFDLQGTRCDNPSPGTFTVTEWRGLQGKMSWSSTVSSRWQASQCHGTFHARGLERGKPITICSRPAGGAGMMSQDWWNAGPAALTEFAPAGPNFREIFAGPNGYHCVRVNTNVVYDYYRQQVKLGHLYGREGRNWMTLNGRYCPGEDCPPRTFVWDVCLAEANGKPLPTECARP